MPPSKVYFYVSSLWGMDAFADETVALENLGSVFLLPELQMNTMQH